MDDLLGKGPLPARDDEAAPAVDKYTPSPDTLARLENDYAYHPPFGDQVERYGKIRTGAKAFALFLVKNCPPSRELSLALTALDQQVVMNANAAIARNEKSEASK